MSIDVAINNLLDDCFMQGVLVQLFLKLSSSGFDGFGIL